MRIRKSIPALLVLLFCCSAYADSAAEKVLAAKLAAAQAALVAAERDKTTIRDTAARDKAALLAALAKSNTDVANRAAASVQSNKSIAAVQATGQANATREAAAAAENAQYIAEQNGIAAQKAADDARIAAAAAAGASATTQSQNIALMITQAFGFLAVLVGLLWKGYTEGRDRRWAKEDAATHQAAVLDKLGEVQTEAHNAYKEANTVNNKIANIGLKVADGQPLAPPKGELKS
jgi:hypothetical protein